MWHLKELDSDDGHVEDGRIQAVSVHRIALALPVFVNVFKSVNSFELQFPNLQNGMLSVLTYFLRGLRERTCIGHDV